MKLQSLNETLTVLVEKWEEWVEGNRIMRNSRWKGTRGKERGKGEDGKRANWREDDWVIRKQHDESWINHLHVSSILNVVRNTGHCPIWIGTHDPHWRLLRPPKCSVINFYLWIQITKMSVCNQQVMYWSVAGCVTACCFITFIGQSHSRDLLSACKMEIYCCW